MYSFEALVVTPKLINGVSFALNSDKKTQKKKFGTYVSLKFKFGVKFKLCVVKSGSTPRVISEQVLSIQSVVKSSCQTINQSMN